MPNQGQIARGLLDKIVAFIINYILHKQRKKILWTPKTGLPFMGYLIHAILHLNQFVNKSLSSEWLESWEGTLLVVTDVSTTCPAIAAVSYSYIYSYLLADWSAETWCYWLPVSRAVMLLVTKSHWCLQSNWFEIFQQEIMWTKST